MNGEFLHIGVTLVVGLIAYLSNRNVNAIEASITEAKNDLAKHDERLREHGESIAAIKAIMDERG